jgi:ABC-type nitrate/sulfonate/bicarbonate transport system permease component
VIRRPISLSLRVGLGAISVMLLVLAYTWLSSSRQATARNELRAVAIERLSELEEQRKQLEQESNAARSEDRDTSAIESRLRENAEEVTEFEEIRDNPQKEDRTVPSWSMLWNDGFLRSATPQGAFERKEIWLLEDFKATGARLLTALLLGVLLSVIVGLAMGCFDPIEAFLMPPFTFFSKVPATAVLPIFFVIVQINFSMFLAIIVFGMLPSLAQAISASARKDVPDELVFKAYTLGASQFELIWNVIFKQVLPRVLDAARLQIGPALVLLVAAEWMVAGEGIGYRLRLFYQRTDMTVVFVYVFILGIVGLSTDYLLIWLRRRLCPWFGD